MCPRWAGPNRTPSAYSSSCREALSASDGRTRPRPASFRRHCRKARPQGDCSCAVAVEADRQRDDLEPTHGDTAFTVPLFDEYLRRLYPETIGEAQAEQATINPLIRQFIGCSIGSLAYETLPSDQGTMSLPRVCDCRAGDLVDS